MARSRAKVDEPKLAVPSDWDVLALRRPIPHDLKRAIDYIRGHVNGNDVDCGPCCALRRSRTNAAQAFSDIHGCFAAHVLAAATFSSCARVLARGLE